jgi:hypothetical protein
LRTRRFLSEKGNGKKKTSTVRETVQLLVSPALVGRSASLLRTVCISPCLIVTFGTPGFGMLFQLQWMLPYLLQSNFVHPSTQTFGVDCLNQDWLL